MKRASEVAQAWGDASEAPPVGWAASLGHPEHEPLPPEELRALRQTLTRQVRKDMRRQLRALGVPSDMVRKLLP